MKAATYSLARETKSGSYSHRIVFKPIGEMVHIVEIMHDELMGDWIGDSQDRTISLAEARAYYRDRKAFGYRAS